MLAAVDRELHLPRACAEPTRAQIEDLPRSASCRKWSPGFARPVSSASAVLALPFALTRSTTDRTREASDRLAPAPSHSYGLIGATAPAFYGFRDSAGRRAGRRRRASRVG